MEVLQQPFHHSLNTCAHATARDKSWAGGESIAGAGLVVEVVATLVALFERERGEGGKVKRRRWEQETRRGRGRRGVSILSCERGMNGKM